MAEQDERLSGPLQESLLTLLLFNQEHGALAAALVSPDHFDNYYRDIASRALEYRRKYRKPPGEAHVDDLFDHVISDPKNKLARTYRQILSGVLDQSRGLNAEYVATRVSEFIRKQTLKAAVVNAGQRYASGGEGLVEDVENILYDALKFRTEGFEAGTRLGDKANLRVFNRLGEADFPTGIRELDRTQFGLTRKAAMVYIGLKGSGKTWYLIHLAKQAVLQGAKVLHITLEMPVEQLVGRYYQSMFGIAKRDEEYEDTTFEMDELGRLAGFRQKTRHPKLHLDDSTIGAYLAKKQSQWGTRFNRLLLKAFPSGRLTIAKLLAYLDGLELSEQFVPDVLLLDYPDLMAIERNDPRMSMSRNMVDLRGILMDRNMAGCFPKQSNRGGAEAKRGVSDFNVAEDWSSLHTADMNLIYNQSAGERRLNLARLYVDKNRSDRDHFTVLISQNYAMGQFVRSSVYLPDQRRYWDLLKAEEGEKED
jgi:hypothetical protein